MMFPGRESIRELIRGWIYPLVDGFLSEVSNVECSLAGAEDQSRLGADQVCLGWRLPIPRERMISPIDVPLNNINLELK